MTEREALDKMIELFDEYSDSFGLCNHDFPDDDFQIDQVEFERRFNEVVCELRGHEMREGYCVRCYASG